MACQYSVHGHLVGNVPVSEGDQWRMTPAYDSVVRLH